MATREQLYSLLGQLAEVRARLAQFAASQHPGDAEVRDVVVTTLDDLEQVLTRNIDTGQPAPPDNGEAARIGIGPNVPEALGGVFTPPGVRSYDEAIVSERLIAIGDLYYAYQHERLGVFRAIYKLQELFKAGALRLTDGAGALGLYRFDRKQVLRYTYLQRMQAYKRVLGYTDAAPPKGSQANAQFHGLFSNFCLQVAQLFRDKRVAEVVRGTGAGTDPSFGSVAMVRRAGLDLRANLKQASYGDGNVLAVELLQLLRAAFEILGADDVKRQLGSENEWDTLEEVLHRYLGETIVASQRSRMGETGRNVIRWLAQPDILNPNRGAFEAAVQVIGEDAEEWLTSAQSVGAVTGQPSPAVVASNVVPLRPRRRVG